MSLSPLHKLEKDAEQQAQKYKQKLIEEGLKQLAEEESARVFPPEGNCLSTHSNAPSDTDDKCGGRDG